MTRVLAALAIGRLMAAVMVVASMPPRIADRAPRHEAVSLSAVAALPTFGDSAAEIERAIGRGR